jgi:hypothetical protein
MPANNPLSGMITQLQQAEGSGALGAIAPELLKNLNGDMQSLQKDFGKFEGDLNQLIGNPITTPAGTDNMGNPIPTPGGADNTSNPITTPGGADNTGNPIPTPGGADNTGNPITTPGGADNTGNPITTPGGADNTGNPITTPGGTDNTGNPIPTPGGTDNTGIGNLPTPVTNNPSDGSGFQIQNGKLLIGGKLLSGVAVTGQYAQQVGPDQLANEIATKFPNINVVRLSTSPEGGAFTNGGQAQNGETIDNIDQTIKALNAKGIGVVLDNHGSDANTADNVSQTGAEPAWFAQIAKDNLNNNMVMFQPLNEPIGSDAAIAQEQKAAYDAIRGTGSNAVVAFDLAGGSGATPMLSNPDMYNQMSNYVIDAHSYAAGSSDPASALQSEVAQLSSLREAGGGAVPVYIGETGNSIDGSNPDPAATAELNAVWSGGTGGIAWLYDGAATGFNGVDHLTNPDGSLTGYGQEIAGLIQNGASYTERRNGNLTTFGEQIDSGSGPIRREE